MSVARRQRTLRRTATVEGFGYFSGRDIRVDFCPAAAGAGVSFIRRDLGDVRLRIAPALRIDVPRRTTLEHDGVRVEMVEHILATLSGLQVDNCDIVVDASEMPGCDGSALPFVQAIDAAGVVDQDARVRQIKVRQTIRVGDSSSWMEARPARQAGLSIAFELDYGAHTAIGRQSIAVQVTPETFRTELAPCRTFLLEEVARAMAAQGIGTRVTPQNLLIFTPAGPIDNTLRFVDECARHKVLDVVGDLALTGCDILADVVAYRSGHKLHAELASRLLEHAAATNDQRATIRLAS